MRKISALLMITLLLITGIIFILPGCSKSLQPTDQNASTSANGTGFSEKLSQDNPETPGDSMDNPGEEGDSPDSDGPGDDRPAKPPEFQLVRDLRDNNQLDRALEQVNKLIGKYPRFDADAYYLRGDIHRIRKNWDESVKDLTKAIELDPTLAEAYMSRADIYLNIFSREKEAQEDFTNALKFEKRPGKIRGIYFDRALATYADNLPMAKKDMEKAFELGVVPGEDDDFGMFGYAYIILGDFEKAEECFLKAAKDRPDSACTYLGQGKVYALSGQYAKARKALQKALDIEYGHQKSERKHVEEIIKVMKNVEEGLIYPIRNYPEKIRRKAILASTYVIRSEPDRAEKIIDQLKKENPGKTEVTLVIAGLYHLMNNREKFDKTTAELPQSIDLANYLVKLKTRRIYY